MKTHLCSAVFLTLSLQCYALLPFVDILQSAHNQFHSKVKDVADTVLGGVAHGVDFNLGGHLGVNRVRPMNKPDETIVVVVKDGENQPGPPHNHGHGHGHGHGHPPPPPPPPEYNDYNNPGYHNNNPGRPHYNDNENWGQNNNYQNNGPYNPSSNGPFNPNYNNGPFNPNYNRPNTQNRPYNPNNNGPYNPNNNRPNNPNYNGPHNPNKQPQYNNNNGYNPNEYNNGYNNNNNEYNNNQNPNNNFNNQYKPNPNYNNGNSQNELKPFPTPGPTQTIPIFTTNNPIPTQASTEKNNEKPTKDDFPWFVPLNPTEIGDDKSDSPKRETVTTKPAEEEDFPIDIRIKE